MGWMSLIGPALGLLGSMTGQGGQNAAAGQLNTQAANAYGGLINDYQPYMGSSLGVLNKAATKGFTPQTYSAAMGRSMEGTDQAIASARNSLGGGTPNMAARTGDMLDAGIRGQADVSATLAGENQKFKTDAAGELAGLGNQAISGGASGLANLGQTYGTAAAAAGNPFSNILSMLTGMGPGGSTSGGGSSFLEGIMGLLGGGGGGASSTNPLNVLSPPSWTGGGSAGAFTPGGGSMGWSPGSTTPWGGMSFTGSK